LPSYNPGIVRYARELRKEKVWHVDEQTLTRNLRRAAVQNPGWWDRSRRMYPRGLILETPPGVLIAKRYPLSPAVGCLAGLHHSFYPRARPPSGNLRCWLSRTGWRQLRTQKNSSTLMTI
jgi:hypothetical protein